MGKKPHLKYKHSTNDEQISTLNSAIINDVTKMIHILTQGNNQEIEELTSLLSSENFEEKNETELPFICSLEFFNNLSNLLIAKNSNFTILQNTFSSFINILVLFSENDNCKISLSSFLGSSLIPNLTSLLGSLDFTQDKTTLIKLFQHFFNLLLLIADLSYENNIQINWDPFVNQLLSKIIFNDLFRTTIGLKEIYLQALTLFSHLIFYFPVEINQSNQIEKYVSFANEVILSNNKEVNQMIISSFVCNCFYLNCVNKFNTANANEYTKQLITKIYQESMKTKDISNTLKVLHEYIEKYLNDDLAEDTEESNDFLTCEITLLEEKLKTYFFYLKTFSDIIENLEIEDNKDNFKNQIITKEDVSDEEMDVDCEIPKEENAEYYLSSKYSDIISSFLNSIFNKNKQLIHKFFNFDSVLEKISELVSCNIKIDTFLIDDFDKMLTIKDLLYQIAYLVLTLLNNIILNFQKPKIEVAQKIFTSITLYLNHSEYYNQKNNFISTTILVIRNLLEQNKEKIPLLLKGTCLDYKLLFQIMNKSINDSFLKTNIIDIVAFIYSNEGSTKEYYDTNREICNLLHSMFYNEQDCEVLAHVINAFMDIYQWDDVELNKILKMSGVIPLIKNGTKEFKSRMNSLQKTGEINSATYLYLNETLINMKRFVKYKEKFFKNN